MNLSFASVLLPCVASIFILIYLSFVQQIETQTTFWNSGSRKNYNLHRRYTRSNQNDHGNITNSNNNHLQFYGPTKPNNALSQFLNTDSNVSQTSPPPQNTIYSTSIQLTSNNITSVTPSTTTYSTTQNYNLNCYSNSPSCQQQCHGRTMLNKTRGYITDGYGNYSVNTQCTWLIDSGDNNSLIRLRFSEFNTECNYDYLYIFDGDSIFSPLVAAFSGIMKPSQTQIRKTRLENLNSLISANTSTSDNTNNVIASINKEDDMDKYDSTFFDEIVISSGRAFIYFHSDTAQSMPGFNLTYSINSCPYDCSGHGNCNPVTYECNCVPEYKGRGCQIEMCPNNCSSDTLLGRCDKLQRKCICVDGYTGSDCSKKTDQGVWTLIENEQSADIMLEGRSFHQALVIDGYIWIIGGKTALLTNFNSKDHWSSIIDRYSLINNKWSADRVREKIEHSDLSEMVGHTAVIYDKKIFIYGGMLANGTISNSLIVFDISSMTFESSNRYVFDKSRKLNTGIEEDFVAPLGVVGHSSTLVGHVMYVFFGYNPIYGYLDIVQKYNIIDNTWTIIETKGSSVEGSIGHSSVYDENSKLILVYGGHHSYKSNSLYSYDPSQSTWRLLHPGPYPRYYHESIIVNGLMIVMGGNSYNASLNQDACDDCFDGFTLMYDLNCIHGTLRNHRLTATGNDISMCDNNCWQTIRDPTPGVLQRYGHTVSKYQSSLYLFGGFNGILSNTLHQYKIPDCLDYSNEIDCNRPKLALKCYWNQSKNICNVFDFIQKQTFGQAKDFSLQRINSSMSAGSISSVLNHDHQCSTKIAQSICESRLTCRDCLHTNYGCRWCGGGQCRLDKCRSLETKAIVDPSLCYSDDTNSSSNGNYLNALSSETYKHDLFLQKERELSTDIECRRYVNCYLCQTKSYCSWQNDLKGQVCSFLPPPRPLPTPTTLQSGPNTVSLMTLNEALFSNQSSMQQSATTLSTTPTPINIWKHIFDNSASFSNSTLNMMEMLNAVTSYQSCESPCFRRKSCRECIQNKCIWCDTSNECIDSSAYFAYYPIGQCMHYVAHQSRCQGTTCSEIDNCDQCQKNPKCGWIDDGTNRGIGQCIEGSSSGPLNGDNMTEPVSTALIAYNHDVNRTNRWYFYTCPLCQCNGHSTCRPGTSICQKNCSGHTEGMHCEKCLNGYYGNPINGGTCRECKCNGHASFCNKENGKCHCSTKGIIGHSCDKCDEQNHYLGDPTSPDYGTCYYNLTTDYQYTFNMSKPDDYFYSDINFMNIPMKRDVDVDFTIVCSSLALVNITSGTRSLTYRHSTSFWRILHTGLECGSFRLKFPYDEHLIGGGSNYTFYVHVYRFQTPFVLQIAFSQHRTLDLWQFFFTFASCFLFLFVMAGVVWKLKQKYDLYRRRQQHVIEMEQMASRPFATILLELKGGFGLKTTSSVDLKLNKYVNSLDQTDNNCRSLIENNDSKVTCNHGDEQPPRSSLSVSRVSIDKFHDVDYHKLTDAPSPISVEPCASGKAGILSLFVQLPGRPNLAIGSALVSLGDDSVSTSSSNNGNINRDKLGSLA